ncbi:MAG TPA: glycosyltransferase 87 family protein [Jatrophihabitans sp.]|jgi:alpha-1,2-mannosyltransferase
MPGGFTTAAFPSWSRRATRWAVLICILSLLGLTLRFVDYPRMLDLAVYRAEGSALRHGLGLYGNIGAPDELPATYPPFAAMLFTVLTAIPMRLAIVLATLGNVALLVAAIELSRRLVNRRLIVPMPPLTTAAAAAVLAWCEPVYSTLDFGQINLLVLVLVLAEFSLPADSRLRGLPLGIAIGLKLTPAVFILYLLVTRRWRWAGRVCTAFAATIAISAAIRPSDTWHFWTKLALDSDRPGSVAQGVNQSLNAVLARMLHTMRPGAVWLVVALVALALGLRVASRAYLVHGEAWGLCAAGVTGLLVSPVSWSHHWVWCVPVALLLWANVRQLTPPARVVAAVAFGCFFLWMPQWVRPGAHDLHMNPAQFVLAMPYVLLGIGFLLALERMSRAPSAVPFAPRAGSFAR